MLAHDDARWLGREIARFAETDSADFRHAGLAYALAGAREAFARASGTPFGAALSAEVHRALTLLDREPGLSRTELADRMDIDPDALSRAFTRELVVPDLMGGDPIQPADEVAAVKVGRSSVDDNEDLSNEIILICRRSTESTDPTRHRLPIGVVDAPEVVDVELGSVPFVVHGFRRYHLGVRLPPELSLSERHCQTPSRKLRETELYRGDAKSPVTLPPGIVEAGNLRKNVGRPRMPYSART